MKYNRLGKAGLRISELSFGSWLTFGKQIDVAAAKDLMRLAFERGVNFFDNAEAYGAGESERVMGAALKDFRRSEVVVSTKIFWGGTGPNDKGLSYKHVVEGTHAALERLGLEYVDLLFCHRPDPDTPIEETVRAMDHLVRQGRCFYWGTSEWPAAALEEAHTIARAIGAQPPSMEQPEYNLFHRERVEREYAPLYERFGMGTTIWSPLASGILTGKYENGVPKGTRLDQVDWLRETLTAQKQEQVKRLARVARGLGCSLAQLSIAWCLKNPDVSSVILGATTRRQLEENLGAAVIKEKLTAQVLAEIEAALGVRAGGERVG